MTDEPTLGHLARTALDDLLVPLGFQSGQGGDGARAGQVIFCAEPSVVDGAFIDLQQLKERIPDGGCLDLVIDFSNGGIDRVDLEGYSLAELLRDLGEFDAARSAEIRPSETVTEGLERARAALTSIIKACRSADA